MFHMLGVALWILLDACPMFVAGTGGEISSVYIDKPGILTLIFHSISGSTYILCNNYFWFCSVPFQVLYLSHNFLRGSAKHFVSWNLLSINIQFIGASLNKPHTTRNALQDACVCLSVCSHVAIYRKFKLNERIRTFKFAHVLKF